MPDRLEIANVVCPASVPSTAPVEVILDFVWGTVKRVHILIPSGHAGLTGIALGYGHQPILPFSGGTFLSGDGEVFHMDYNDPTPGVPWSAFVCNDDLQSHSWQIRFEIDETPDSVSPPLTVALSTSDIINAGNAALTGA